MTFKQAVRDAITLSLVFTTENGDTMKIFINKKQALELSKQTTLACEDDGDDASAFWSFNNLHLQLYFHS